VAEQEQEQQRPELHHVIGAILRDLSKARVAADVYSRNVSKYYEQDTLLRLFPIPRTEINEVNVDLKFAISETSLHERTAVPGAETVTQRFSEEIVDTVFDELRSSEKTNTASWKLFLNSVEEGIRPVLLITVVELLENPSVAIAERAEAIREVEEQLQILLNDSVYSRLESDYSDTDKEFKDVFTTTGSIRVAVKNDITEKFSDVVGAMAVTLKLRADAYNVIVSVKSDELQSLPEMAISSVRITTTMRNYVWSQGEEIDGEVVRRLIPE
jgi:hypothetical protein